MVSPLFRVPSFPVLGWHLFWPYYPSKEALVIESDDAGVLSPAVPFVGFVVAVEQVDLARVGREDIRGQFAGNLAIVSFGLQYRRPRAADC